MSLPSTINPPPQLGLSKGVLLSAVGPISEKQKRRKARSLKGFLAKMPLSYAQGGTGEAQLLALIQQRRNLPYTNSEGLKNYLQFPRWQGAD